MADDDLSQRLWRDGAKRAWEEEQSCELGWKLAQDEQDNAEAVFTAFVDYRRWSFEKVRELELLKEEAEAHSGPECMAIAHGLEAAEAEITRLREKVDLKQVIFQAQVTETKKLQDMIAYVDLHIGNFPIKKLTTEQKELWADCVDASGARMAEAEGWDDPHVFPRWWREDYVGPMPR